MSDTPEKLTPNEIIKQHGIVGGLILTLQRYALLGWIFFAVMLFFYVLTVLISSISPKPIVVVNEAGVVLGTLEYVSPNSRSDEEIKAVCKRFTSSYMSMNAETVFDDFADALNMMDDVLLKETNEMLKKDNYLARIKGLNARSRLEFSRQDGVVLVSRRDMKAECRLIGNLIVDTGGKDGPIAKPFDITLTTRIVARNTDTPVGLKIVSRKDN